MMTLTILAGTYFREDIIAGNKIAACISLIMLVPLLMIWTKRFFTLANVFAWGAIAYAVIDFIKPLSCPPYWQGVLPVYLAFGTTVLVIVRWCIHRSVAWYLIPTVVIFVFWGIPWFSDLRSVVNGEHETAKEYRERLQKRAKFKNDEAP